MDVVITKTGFNTLLILKNYMRQHLEEVQLNNLMEQLISEATRVIQLVPKRPPCPELSGIGIYDYLQINCLDKYKVLYRFNEGTQEVFIIAFMRQRQSAEKLLVDLALLG